MAILMRCADKKLHEAGRLPAADNTHNNALDEQWLVLEGPL